MLLKTPQEGNSSLQRNKIQFDLLYMYNYKMTLREELREELFYIK